MWANGKFNDRKQIDGRRKLGEPMCARLLQLFPLKLFQSHETLRLRGNSIYYCNCEPCSFDIFKKDIQNIGFHVYLFDSFCERITRRMAGSFLY